MQCTSHEPRLYRMLPVFLVLLMFLGGCSARIEQFKKFGDLSSAYATAFNSYIDASFTVFMEYNSYDLVINQSEDYNIRNDNISYNDAEARDRIVYINSLKEHIKTLNKYFQSLSVLASSDAPATTAANMKDLVNKLEALGANIGGTNAGGIAESATQIIVTGIQLAALERELQLHGQIISDQIHLEKQALQDIQHQMGFYSTSLQDQRMQDSVTDRYLSPDPLPDKWASIRNEIYIQQMQSDELNTALEAANKLEEAFSQLCTNKITIDYILSLEDNANNLLSLINTISK